MKKMITTAWGKLNINHTCAFKLLFVTNSLDGPENYLVSDRLLKLIGESMASYREELSDSETGTSLFAVVKELIPPKGIKPKNLVSSKHLQ